MSCVTHRDFFVLTACVGRKFCMFAHCRRWIHTVPADVIIITVVIVAVIVVAAAAAIAVHTVWCCCSDGAKFATGLLSPWFSDDSMPKSRCSFAPWYACEGIYFSKSHDLGYFAPCWFLSSMTACIFVRTFNLYGRCLLQLRYRPSPVAPGWKCWCRRLRFRHLKRVNECLDDNWDKNVTLRATRRQAHLCIFTVCSVWNLGWCTWLIQLRFRLFVSFCLPHI